ncbi:helix-turn-helix domain-containing protein [Paenarthrobacter nicotinovorans]|uniref:helix-turn-helix domain-containing protein n=1 Tax=Paenarthrobacter nicotinovorans TaxID=29320 RepID=UPI0037494D9E
MKQPESLKELVELAIQRHDASGLALSQLAQRAGYTVTYTTINQIRQGTYKSIPREPTLRALAWLAGVDDSVAFTAAGQPAPGPPFAEELPPGVDNLSPRSRKIMIDLARVLVDLEKAEDASNTTDQGQPTDIRDAGKRRNPRSGQKTNLASLLSDHDAPADGNIPLPDNWQDLAAYTGPTSHKDRERKWDGIGEESQDSDTDN